LKEQQLQHHSTLDSLLDPHLLLDAVRDHAGVVRDFRFADANETALHVLQTTKEKLLGSSFLTILPGTNHSPWMTLLLQAVASGDYLVRDDVADPTGLLVPADGFVGLRAIRVSGVLSLTWRDVTERHQMMRRIAASEQQRRLLTENASDVVMLLRQGIIEWISPSLNRMLGWSQGRWVGHLFDQFVHREDLGLAKQCFQEEHYGGSRVTRLRFRDSLGQHHWVEAHSSSIFSEAGLPDGIVASFRTVDQEVASEQALERRARFDDLTGLVNRSEMLERFRILLTSRPRRVPMAVLFVDSDQFKHINDTYGHAGGDCVLKIMALRIHQTLRKRDWAARIGGDEMLVVLYGLNELGQAMAIGEKLRLAAHQPIDFGVQQIKLSIGVGVTLATSAESVDAIIARADQAMYLAKRQGRDQVMAIPA
jgi:diguanylate cyclase (GGDEF)-like protein/PAS domain S-box-containing protein